MAKLEKLQAILLDQSPTQQRQSHKHKLMMLGYNQALLDHAEFPIRGLSPDDPGLSRPDVEAIVSRLRRELEEGK